MKAAYLDCFSGISGDMTLGAFLDAGLSLKTLLRRLAKLKVKGYRLTARKVWRGAISGTKFNCTANGCGRGHHSLKDILRLIDRSSLNKRIKDSASSIFTAIGDAEAKVHGVKAKKDIVLYELGNIDSIVDIVGTAIACDELGIDEVYASRVSLGRTFVDSKHGALPIPAPATLELLKGVPTRITELAAELVTPTGAGILKVLAKDFGRSPEMDISAIGYGAGTKDLAEQPNMLRLVIGDTARSFAEDSVIVIEANIDDMSPQIFEYVFERLFDAGALDVYVTNIMMKKSRPAFKLTAIARPGSEKRLAAIILRETTTIGARYYETGRFKLDRKTIAVSTRYGKVNVKVSSGPDGIRAVSPEYNDCVKLAKSKKAPLKTVYEEAKNAARGIRCG